MAVVLEISILVAYGLLIASMAMAVWRLLVGPTLADRVVALDFLSLAAIGFIAVTAVATRRYDYLDVAIATALVAFLATVALARYLLRRSPRRPVQPERVEASADRKNS